MQTETTTLQLCSFQVAEVEISQSVANNHTIKKYKKITAPLNNLKTLRTPSEGTWVSVGVRLVITGTDESRHVQLGT
jgi:hypothetical protein